MTHTNNRNWMIEGITTMQESIEWVGIDFRSGVLSSEEAKEFVEQFGLKLLEFTDSYSMFLTFALPELSDFELKFLVENRIHNKAGFLN